MRMKGRRKQWQDLSERQRAGMGALMAVQLGLFLFSLVDLVRRPSDRVRGRKLAWVPVLFVNFIGPLTYLAVGRRAPAAGSARE